MRVIIINNAQKNDFKFSKPILDLVKEFLDSYLPDDGHEVNLVHWEDVHRETKCDVDAIIASGSLQGDDPMESHAPKYLEEGLQMHSIEVPFFGICTALHLQSHTRGVPLIHMDQSETGLTSVTATIPCDPIFEGLLDENNTFKAEEMHNDSIKLPLDFDLLATTVRCPVQLIRHKTLPLFYASQFHPEVHKHTHVMLTNFIKMAHKRGCIHRASHTDYTQRNNLYIIYSNVLLLDNV